MKVISAPTVALAMLLANSEAASEERFLSYAGFELERATFAQVQARLGASTIRHEGDASEAVTWICYSAGNAEVRFMSGELGGGTQLQGISVSHWRHKGGHVCPMPREPLPLAVGPAHLGQSIEQFRAAIPARLKWSGATASADFESTATSARGEPVDVSVSISGTFRAGHLIRLQVWKVESL